MLRIITFINKQSFVSSGQNMVNCESDHKNNDWSFLRQVAR